MSVPSTPDFVSSVAWFKVPCGAAASTRKFLQLQRAAVATIRDAAPKASGCLDVIFIVSPICEFRRSLERGAEADGERSAARIGSAVDAPILISNIAGRAEDIRRWERRIEPVVSGDREHVLDLQVHARRR